METIPCPGCRTALEPSATVCPICLRGRGKLEIIRAYATLREMEKQRKKRPFVIAGRVLAAAAIGGLLFRYHEPVLSAASAAQSSVSKFANDMLYPPGPARPAVGTPPPAPETRPAPANDSGPAAAPAASASAPGVAAPPVPAKPARREKVEDLPLPPFDPATQWVIYGRVFDLITLLPVENVQFNFRQNGGFGNAVSDAEGRFSVALVRAQDDRGYEIHAVRTGYAPAILAEPDIPYARLTLAQRRDIVRSAQDGDVSPPRLSDDGENSMRRDIYLAPAR
ncbi:MAG TPA: carboxypeptidase-like regulatory domain-containing protein [Elusimicrobiota bacterium]|nr:carboxypeptidase-like regulatory domain-containing protein [Elusimicrobiota bacterium]